MCLDELGPESAKSYPGQDLVRTEPTSASPAGRAKQEIDYGRRGTTGYVFGALRHVTGEVLTAPYTGRTTKNWIAFLEQVEAWLLVWGRRRRHRPRRRAGIVVLPKVS